MKCRSSPNEVLDSLGERNLIHSFLQLLGNDDEKDIDRFVGGMSSTLTTGPDEGAETVVVAAMGL